MSKENRRQRSDSVAGLVAAAKAANSENISPPSHISVPYDAEPFWLDIVRARARSEWTEVDLSAAANLACCLWDIERLRNELQVEGDLVANGRGTLVVNPKHNLLETLSRRHLALVRLLQIQPAASGKTESKVGARKIERQARDAADEVSQEEDGLLA